MKNSKFKLPITFDEAALIEDLSTCRRLQWGGHFNQKDYVGTWTSIALRSASGREDDIYSHPTVQAYVDTPLLAQCTYFRQVCDWFQCEKESIRLLSLAPGSLIKEHTDPHTGYPYGLFRLHIPIQTATAVQFRVAGVDLPMQAGECWYANFHLPHSVQNAGPVERVHLVIDCRRNAWSDGLFKEAGYDFDEEKREAAYSQDTKRRMIDELSRMESDSARQLVIQLQLELGESA
ncbi:MAG TPA: aspartyl/asparaginyl beta-hydroxylase domain-containing protein [Fibrella sp.]